MPRTLGRTSNIAIDMGPERGPERDNTVSACTDFLYSHGFAMRAFNHDRRTALFENTNLV